TTSTSACCRKTWSVHALSLPLLQDRIAFGRVRSLVMGGVVHRIADYDTRSRRSVRRRSGRRLRNMKNLLWGRIHQVKEFREGRNGSRRLIGVPVNVRRAKDEGIVFRDFWGAAGVFRANGALEAGDPSGPCPWPLRAVGVIARASVRHELQL